MQNDEALHYVWYTFIDILLMVYYARTTMLHDT